MTDHQWTTVVLFVAVSILRSDSGAGGLEKWQPRNYYRIHPDPDQVKEEKITMSNLFKWLNLKNTVKFRLWTRQNPHLAHEIVYQNVHSLNTSHFDPRRLTKFIIHGFADTATEVAVTPYLFQMRDAYLHLGDVNVFIIDYALFVLPIFYYAAVPDLPAARLAEFIQFLLLNSKLSLSSVHLIGFSLGAQLAGIAGFQLKGRLGRITGLDPAGPTFHYVSNSQRLDRSDAQFVDIIHTSAGKNFWGEVKLGIEESLAHADFFPNGGSHQTGHAFWNFLALECSHGRSVRYFTESITSPLAFPALQCDSYQRYLGGDCNSTKTAADLRVFMGEHLNFRTRGKYQLISNPNQPYGKGSKMKISLPNVIYNKAHLKIGEHNPIIGTAIIVFNNTQLMEQFNRSSYSASGWSNNDGVRKLCDSIVTQGSIY